MTTLKKTKTIKISIPETKLYQMVDSEGEPMGLLKTNLPIKKLAEAWGRHYADEKREEWGVGLFVDEMKKKHRASFYTFERIVLESIIYP